MERLFQVVPAGSSIIAMIPYGVVNMDMKKVMALAMMALMVIPSLTVTVGADNGDGAGLAGAIERAQTYLGKVRTIADNMAIEYEDDVTMQGYLDELYDLLGKDWEEDPEILFQLDKDGEATAELSEVISHSENHSAHLETTGNVDRLHGDEARIVIPMPDGFTLGDLETLSWWEYLVTGYPPHVDVYLELGEHDDSLNFEYAYNKLDHYAEGQITGETSYGALQNDWYRTFGDDGYGPIKIDAKAKAWPNSGDSGPPNSIELHTLAEWKGGITYTTDFTRTINASCIVTRLEIEVDNWVIQTETYVDDIKINKDIYDFEEEEQEGLGAEGLLAQASDYLDAGDIKSAARSFASARNILGRIKGLLNSMAKAHKVTRTEKFERRIQGIRDKMERRKGPKK